MAEVTGSNMADPIVMTTVLGVHRGLDELKYKSKYVNENT